MSSYVKPQSPLYHKTEDAFFYPLTTVDQVMLENGERLNSELEKHVSIDLSDNNSNTSEAPPIDADTLGGHPVNYFLNTENLPLSIEHGGFGSNTVEGARTNLNVYDKNEVYNKNEIFDVIYPVGSIYMSVNYTNPSVLFGGTWEQIQDRFLLASGNTYSAGSTGGEATHTLTVNEMPSHNHSPSNRHTAGSDTNYKRQFTTNLHTSSDSVGRNTVGSGGSNYAMTAKTSSDITGVDYTSETGGSQPHNNMPPYLAVYVWKRVS